ncbi:iron-containing redox enzyme family protein [Vibrio echinoideorum]|uniref:iron-containing redox enzyme family protein n=1 Tax=Vibrio echinoideorum TaxID=2100116 RepID=UPI003553108B
MSIFRNELKEICDEEWSKIKKGKFYTLVLNEDEPDVDLYISAMIQVFHYTKNNSINQAIATYAEDHKKVGLLHFAMKHAIEELGHENMVVHDLKSIGVDESVFLDQPIPATEALNGYLDSISLRGGVIPRLGYSFWAEDSYEHLAPLLNLCKNKLKLDDDQLTFFIEHAEIDMHHSKDVNDAIDEWVTSDADKKNVKQVARTTLYLTGRILESVAEDYMNNKGNEY